MKTTFKPIFDLSQHFINDKEIEFEFNIDFDDKKQNAKKPVVTIIDHKKIKKDVSTRRLF